MKKFVGFLIIFTAIVQSGKTEPEPLKCYSCDSDRDGEHCNETHLVVDQVGIEDCSNLGAAEAGNGGGDAQAGAGSSSGGWLQRSEQYKSAPKSGETILPVCFKYTVTIKGNKIHGRGCGAFGQKTCDAVKRSAENNGGVIHSCKMCDRELCN